MGVEQAMNRFFNTLSHEPRRSRKRRSIGDVALPNAQLANVLEWRSRASLLKGLKRFLGYRTAKSGLQATFSWPSG